METIKQAIVRKGTKQKFFAEKFNVSETIISTLIKHEDVYLAMKKHLSEEN